MLAPHESTLSFGCAELVRNEKDVTISKIITNTNEYVLVLGDATVVKKGSTIERLAKSLLIGDVHYPIIEPQSDCKASWMEKMNPYMQYSGLAVALIYVAILFAFDEFKGM